VGFRPKNRITLRSGCYRRSRLEVMSSEWADALWWRQREWDAVSLDNAELMQYALTNHLLD
jgi:hypothetical protein